MKKLMVVENYVAVHVSRTDFKNGLFQERISGEVLQTGSAVKKSASSSPNGLGDLQ
jgi:hypothetical protein